MRTLRYSLVLLVVSFLVASPAQAHGFISSIRGSEVVRGGLAKRNICSCVDDDVFPNVEMRPYASPVLVGIWQKIGLLFRQRLQVLLGHKTLLNRCPRRLENADWRSLDREETHQLTSRSSHCRRCGRRGWCGLRLPGTRFGVCRTCGWP